MSTFDEEMELPKKKEDAPTQELAIAEENSVHPPEPTPVETTPEIIPSTAQETTPEKVTPGEVTEPVAPPPLPVTEEIVNEPQVLEVSEAPVMTDAFPLEEAPAPEIVEPILETTPVESVEPVLETAPEPAMEPVAEEVIAAPEAIIEDIPPVATTTPEPEITTDSLTDPEAPVEPAQMITPDDVVIAETEGETTSEPLNKKLKVENATAKPKDKGKLIMIISIILIIAILAQAGWFFYSQGYIEIPWFDELIKKSPNSNSSPDPNPDPEPDIKRLFGDYKENDFKVCPTEGIELTLNSDLSFRLLDLKLSDNRKTCNTDELVGTFTAENGVIVFNIENREESLTASYDFENDIVRIKITSESGIESELFQLSIVLEVEA